MWHGWQDHAIALAQVIFIFANIQAIVGRQKPPTLMSFLSCAGIGLIAVTAMSLEFWFTTTTSILAALEWLVLGIQTTRIAYGRASYSGRFLLWNFFITKKPPPSS